MLNGSTDRVNVIWQIAELLRGDYRRFENGKVILPLVVLRRLDCVLADKKAAVLAEAASLEGQITRLDPVLTKVAGYPFYNTSPWDLNKLLGDPENLATNLRMYIGGFSDAAADVLKRFRFDEEITRLDEAGLLYLVVGKFAEVELHPNAVANHEMGYIYEELIRKFSEQSNETAGEHFTPREVIRLMVALLFEPDREILADGHQRRTLYDPTCGTGGMLSVAEDYLRDLNPDAQLEVFGQELNPETYAICRSDMMLKGQDATHIAFDNTLTKDAFKQATFDYCLSNPPFGVDWKKIEGEIRKDFEGQNSRFQAGLPRITDGSLLFLQHMVSKMKPAEDGGSRIAIVFNGSPLFSGDAGSGESEIRRWIVENDWLEAVVALPDQLFYNTGLSTYFWIVTNRKSSERAGKVQVIDAREHFVKAGRSLGEKRKEISDDQAAAVIDVYGAFADAPTSRVLANSALGYQRIAVEQPLRLRYRFGEVERDAIVASPDWPRLVGEDPSLEARIGGLEGLNTTSQSDARARVLAVGPLPKGLDKVLWTVLGQRDPDAPVVTDTKGRALPDPTLRDSEIVPLPDGSVSYGSAVTGRVKEPAHLAVVDSYLETDVLPYTPGAWVDHSKTKIGYEIPVTRMFFKPPQHRSLAEIDAELLALDTEVRSLLEEARG